MTTQFQNQEVVELRDGTSRVLIAPAFGARLLTWERNGEALIHWSPDADWSSLQALSKTRGGNPILFPFLGRHFVNGVLGQWRDSSGVIRELPMHGFAREMPFEVIECDARVLRMRLAANDETRAMYPFDFHFDVIYRLDGKVLEATFETSNLGSTPLPYYAGHHFYFSIPHDERANWQIELPCKTWGRQNPDGSVAFQDTTSTHATLDDANLIDRFHLDFLEPHATLRNSDANKIIAIEWDGEYPSLWYDVTTWTLSPESDFFCVEPWLGLPNAIHHGEGLRWIGAGERETATCRIAVK
jgi:galactose mutarotase-like enzyme